MNAPAWLTARPIAHRGLHDRAAGRIENSAAAARAAVERGFAVECDVQVTADGEAVVFHDFTLDRLTAATGRVDVKTASQLAAVGYHDSIDTVMSLATLLVILGGRVPLVCEIKSRFDGDMRLAERTAQVVAGVAAPIALKSFDPAVIAHLRRQAVALGIGDVPLGMIAQARYDYDEWTEIGPDAAFRLANLLHYNETRPDFLSYSVKDLPHAVPFLCRQGIGLPVMTWTVRTAAQVETARLWADQMVFEGFMPA